MDGTHPNPRSSDMFTRKPLPTGEDLKEECERQGINTDNIYHSQTGRITGPEQRQMQQLLLDINAVARERVMICLSGVAVISAIISTLIALWVAFR